MFLILNLNVLTRFFVQWLKLVNPTAKILIGIC